MNIVLKDHGRWKSIMVERKLEVFLSSDSKEFYAERTYLSRIISKIQFLNCELLERKGAKPLGTLAASLEGVRKSQILVGVIGEKDSPITKKEIEEAIRLRLPGFVYIKESSYRDPEMKKFVEEIVMPEYTYHMYRTRKDLYDKIQRNLKDHIMDLLDLGLKDFKNVKNEAVKIEKKEEIFTRQITKKQKLENLVENLLNDAEDTYQKGDYLSSVARSITATEVALREILKDRGISSSNLMVSIGSLMGIARKFELLEQRDANALMELRHIKNAALHMGKAPNQDATKFALMVARRLTDKLSHIISIPKGSGHDQSCVKTRTCFKPERLVISVNNTIKWINDDSIAHTICSGVPSYKKSGEIFDSSVITPQRIFTYTFTEKGTFPYFCLIHPWQRGTIVVE